MPGKILKISATAQTWMEKKIRFLFQFIWDLVLWAHIRYFVSASRIWNRACARPRLNGHAKSTLLSQFFISITMLALETFFSIAINMFDQPRSKHSLHWKGKNKSMIHGEDNTSYWNFQGYQKTKKICSTSGFI